MFTGKLPEAASDDQKREHEALTALAKKYTSLPEAAKALRKAELRFTSGQVITKLQPNATADEVKAWRAENGIPETPDKYDLKLEPGLVVSAEDKQMLQPILAAMHKVNAPPQAVSAGVNAYFLMREEEVAAAAKANEEVQRATKIALTEEWGARDMQANIEGIALMLDNAGKEVADAFEQAAGIDGVRLLNNPAVMRFLAKHAREAGYVGATPTGGDFGAGMQAERDRLQKMMVEDPDKWYSPENAKNVERFRDILAAEARKAQK